MDWKTIYKELKMRSWFILLVLSSLSYFLSRPAQTLGVILGGLIIMVNFGLLQHTICGVFSPQGTMTRTKISIILKYYLRLLALGMIIYILITRALVDPIGLAIGLSTVVFSIVSLGIDRARKMYAEEAV
jgi:hypothetical protein